MPTSLTGRLKALDTCAVSDALDFLGITGATTGIHSMWGRQKIAGRARTVEAVDAQGHWEPNANNEVHFSISGTGSIVAV